MNRGRQSRRATPERRTQRGLTLIEVLVAVLVIAIGLLGYAGLQATSLRYNHGAYTSTQATTLAVDIADRMRANPNAARDGAYDLGFDDDTSSGGGTVAANDLHDWRTTLTDLLPEGTSAVDVDNDGNARIDICWLADRSMDAPSLETDCSGDRKVFTYRTRI
ncbi:type IV pilus modification protein PilV [Halofilum ochraceum]|uniref:type IV pilus modification protein PilV n=1 Tax=Halofilum ochraceum TaxID=1611323 RepID=UPI0008D9C568|nr:type IV pilus modification protein PilV [Halofilum ochraceum]